MFLLSIAHLKKPLKQPRMWRGSHQKDTCHCLTLQAVETDAVLATAILSGQAKAERPDFWSLRIETSGAI